MLFIDGVESPSSNCVSYIFSKLVSLKQVFKVSVMLNDIKACQLDCMWYINQRNVLYWTCSKWIMNGTLHFYSVMHGHYWQKYPIVYKGPYKPITICPMYTYIDFLCVWKMCTVDHGTRTQEYVKWNVHISRKVYARKTCRFKCKDALVLEIKHRYIKHLNKRQTGGKRRVLLSLCRALYSALSISRVIFSPNILQKTPNSLPVMARYEVSLWVHSLYKVLDFARWNCVHYGIILNRDISRVYSITISCLFFHIIKLYPTVSTKLMSISARH